MSYIVYDALFFHKRGDKWLVVSRTPPAWVIVNELGYQVLSHLPVQCHFSADDIALEGVSKDILKEYLENLAASHLIIRDTDLPLLQLNRKLRVNGIYFEITHQCNLRCKHCYVSADSTKMDDTMLSRQDIMNTIYQIAPPAEIGFSGGEPLMRPDCMSMIREVVSKGYLCTLLTNGLLITEELAQELATLGVTVQVSLEGSTPEINDAIRGRGSYDAAVRAIQILVANHVKVRVSVTPTTVNYKDFDELIKAIKNLGVDSLHVCTFTPQGRGKENLQDLSIPEDELYKFQQAVYEAAKTFDIMGNLPETLDINRVGYLWDKCPLGGSIHIGYDGNIYPCEIAATKSMVIGNVKQMSLTEALMGTCAQNFVSNSRERIELIAQCRECEWKHFCGGGCMVLAMAQNEDINTVDYLCNSRKKWFEQLLWENYYGEANENQHRTAEKL